LFLLAVLSIVAALAVARGQAATDPGARHRAKDGDVCDGSPLITKAS
jgi:hypothetical protein